MLPVPGILPLAKELGEERLHFGLKGQSYVSCISA